MLWVGEAPGKQEELEGRPFVGASGEVVQNTLKWAGIDVDVDVRFSTVCHHNPGTWPTGAASWKLMMEYADELDSEMASMPNLQVVVACGGVALRRLCGQSSITDWRGSIIRAESLPHMLRQSAGRGGSHNNSRILSSPAGVTYVPVLHPSGIMRGGWDEMVLFRRDVRKVACVLNGTLKRVDVRHHFNVPPAALLEAREGAAWMYFDTEYHRESKQLYWFGATFNGVDVFGVPWTPDYYGVISGLLRDQSLRKGAHNIAADMEALQLAGVEVAPPLYDSMVGFHTLYPTLPIGLGTVASYYLDDIRYWKDMDHHDPHYNALDVAYGAQCMLAEQREAAQLGAPFTDELAARMALIPATYAMYKRGMRVDMATRESMLKVTAKEVDTRNTAITREVTPMWDARVRKVLDAYARALIKVDDASSEYRDKCSKHRYNGIKGRVPQKCPECLHIWEQATSLRASYPTMRRELAHWNGERLRLEDGFKATNTEHLQWLLYDPDALHLPIQRHHKTKAVTSDKDAIDKLTRLAYMRTPTRAKALTLVSSIKRVQELEKARSTFISLQRKVEGVKVSLIDADDRVHPLYGRYTETGRMAGAGDDDTEGTAFYALNIPKAWRRLYVAPPGCIIVAADWKNCEGRLAAYFSKDARYQAALDAELTGGPKVHSLNAAIIFGCAPEDAERHVVTIGGQKVKAYDMGKKLTHAWSYGMGIDTMMRHFRISRAEAEVINAKLSDAYPTLVQWRRALVTQVLGMWDGKRCTQAGSRMLMNPFGWRRFFMGVGYGQSNEVLAFLPQSSGGSMLVRTIPAVNDEHPVMVAVHDSIAVICQATGAAIDSAAGDLSRIMSQPWPQLQGATFPVSLEAGYNWGPARNDNPRGMTAI